MAKGMMTRNRDNCQDSDNKQLKFMASYGSSLIGSSLVGILPCGPSPWKRLYALYFVVVVDFECYI